MFVLPPIELPLIVLPPIGVEFIIVFEFIIFVFILLALVLVLVFAASPQAIPNALIAKTAERAKVFFILLNSPVFFKD